jgi:general secretion pathway protein G
MNFIKQSRRLPSQAGLTLLELIIACAILLVLSSAALPIARWTAYREREKELRRDLLEMRQAIDRYKDLADRGQIRVDIMTGGYPPDL